MLKTFQSSYLMSQVVFLLLLLIEISTRECSFLTLIFGRNSPILFALTERSSTGVVCQEKMMCLHIYFQNFIRVLSDLTGAKGLPPSM